MNNVDEKEQLLRDSIALDAELEAIAHYMASYPHTGDDAFDSQELSW